MCVLCEVGPRVVGTTCRAAELWYCVLQCSSVCVAVLAMFLNQTWGYSGASTECQKGCNVFGIVKQLIDELGDSARVPGMSE